MMSCLARRKFIFSLILLSSKWINIDLLSILENLDSIILQVSKINSCQSLEIFFSFEMGFFYHLILGHDLQLLFEFVNVICRGTCVNGLGNRCETWQGV